MDNKEIVERLEFTGKLLELHGENEFKARGYTSAAYKLDKLDNPLENKSLLELEKLEGIGKTLAKAIHDLNQSGKFPLLEDLMAKTPPGVLSIMNVPGIGPKKIGIIWRELGIADIPQLLTACREGRLSSLKGFGKKLEQNIIEAIDYQQANEKKFLFHKAEKIIIELVEKLKRDFENLMITPVGAFRRKLETINGAEFVIGTDDPEEIIDFLDELESLQKNPMRSGPRIWRGIISHEHMEVEFRIAPVREYQNYIFKYTGTDGHLALVFENNKSLLQIQQENTVASEKEIYTLAGSEYFPPETREGLFEFQFLKEDRLNRLIENDDLTGILHNHSTYSDGRNSLREMAETCKKLGYQYFGICDHSVTAIYANGLTPERILDQHREIDALNKELAPFKIFKGIESDIRVNGALDYEDEVLNKFDFVVASVHGSFSNDIEKATQRLLTAIQNPYTTILGHPSGRILLRREGYPLDYKKIIEACAKHNVIIEINADPHRLDLDWRWVPYAVKKNVLISINPDAHSKQGLQLMGYGVNIARKGGLTKELTFNSWPAKEVENYFLKRKQKTKTAAG